MTPRSCAAGKAGAQLPCDFERFVFGEAADAPQGGREISPATSSIEEKQMSLDVADGQTTRQMLGWAICRAVRTSL